MKSSSSSTGLWSEAALRKQVIAIQNEVTAAGAPPNVKDLCTQFILLSKMLDSLVAYNMKPPWRQEIVPVIKLLCKFKDSTEARPSLLVLLLSVKGACQSGWLQLTGTEDIFSTLKLLFEYFTMNSDSSMAQLTVAPSGSGGLAAIDIRDAAEYFSSTSLRYYPQLKIKTIFVALQAKAGYEVLVCDFHVPPLTSPESVRLYVGRKDIVNSSACLITPPQVNFLVNGKEVDRRVTVGFLDGGPQLPTDVTMLVKAGSNVLQVIGEFPGPYSIAVASTIRTALPAANTQLQDYVLPSAKTAGLREMVEADDEVVEGASRVSLRCPVSHQRLVTPVKAATCRHLQCFDYDTFLEINERRPAWRCPCCNCCITWLDLRVDRQMEKVLKEADETVAEVLMMQDGSWKCVVLCEDKCMNGIDGAINDLSEVGKVCVNDEEASVINLCCDSDFEEELRAEAMNCADAEPPDRKPSSQVLQVLIGDGNQSRGATPATQEGLRVDSSLLRPSSGPSTVSNFRDISATGVQGSTGFPGPLRSVPITSGLSGCIRPILSERQGYSQPGLQPPAIVQALPALHSQSYYANLGSHGSPGTHLGSTGAHVNSLASSSGHTASLQLPHSLMVSDMDTSPREATGAARQRWRGVQTLQNPIGPRSSTPQGSQGGLPARSPGDSSVLGGHGLPPTCGNNWRSAGRMRGSIAPMGAVRNTGQSSSAIPWVSPGAPTTDFVAAPAHSPGVGLSLISNGIGMGLTNARPALVGSSTTGEVLPNGSAWAGTPDSELRPFVVMGVNSLDGWMSFANSNLGTDPGGR